MTARSAGARPVLTARSSIAGLRPSMTARTSFGGPGKSLAQDSQPRVLLALAAPPAGQEPDEEADREHAHRRDEDRQRGEDHRDALGVDRQRRGGLRVEARARAREQ